MRNPVEERHWKIVVNERVLSGCFVFPFRCLGGGYIEEPRMDAKEREGGFSAEVGEFRLIGVHWRFQEGRLARIIHEGVPRLGTSRVLGAGYGQHGLYQPVAHRDPYPGFMNNPG